MARASLLPSGSAVMRVSLSPAGRARRCWSFSPKGSFTNSWGVIFPPRRMVRCGVCIVSFSVTVTDSLWLVLPLVVRGAPAAERLAVATAVVQPVEFCHQRFGQADTVGVYLEAARINPTLPRHHIQVAAGGGGKKDGTAVVF